MRRERTYEKLLTEILCSLQEYIKAILWEGVLLLMKTIEIL